MLHGFIAGVTLTPDNHLEHKSHCEAFSARLLILYSGPRRSLYITEKLPRGRHRLRSQIQKCTRKHGVLSIMFCNTRYGSNAVKSCPSCPAYSFCPQNSLYICWRRSQSPLLHYLILRQSTWLSGGQNIDKISYVRHTASL